MVRALARPRGILRLSLQAAVVVLLAASAAQSQQDAADWQQQLREQVNLHQLKVALAIVDQRLDEAPADLEARGWRGRLLAWQGQWVAAESEYRQVLQKAPRDTEILCGLADVLLWEGQPKNALEVIDRAREVNPTQLEILLRRARILEALAQSAEARSQYHEILRSDPGNEQAKHGVAGLAEETRHEFRIGSDASTFSYTSPAEDEVLSLTSHWTTRFATTFTAGFYQRFGQDARNLIGNTSFRLTKSDSFSVGAAVANNQGIIPRNETFFEYGHGFHFSNRWVKGLEASYLQHWFWYEGAHVVTFSVRQIYYLPKDWTWLVALTGAHSGFTGTGVEWVPSGSTRLEFPLRRYLAGNVRLPTARKTSRKSIRSAISPPGHMPEA